jgi:hypothetical protein
MAQNRLGGLRQLIDGPRLGGDMFPGPLEEETRQRYPTEAGMSTADPVQPVLEGEAEEVSGVTLGLALPLLQINCLMLQKNRQQLERQAGIASFSASPPLPCLDLLPAVGTERHEVPHPCVGQNARRQLAPRDCIEHVLRDVDVRHDSSSFRVPEYRPGM